ncbi:MAG: alanine dehydrogenase [Deltaproteobacteria bacterium]|nr:alanine dehydrogenase [Deltaproteobacteria bacterium]
MIIGIPKEIKEGENRIAHTPNNVEGFTSKGHKVLVETNAGLKSGFSDDDYKKAGAEIINNASEVFKKAEMITKVKEILPVEFDFIQEQQIIFTYIHSAIRREETDVLLNKKVVGIAYEDVMAKDGSFPLLIPMSQAAGMVGMLIGVYHLFSTNGGNGILMGGMPGVESAKVVILGAGHLGINAAKYALGLGADVTILDVSVERLREIKYKIFPDIKTLYSSQTNIKKLLPETDLLVNCVKWYPGLTLVTKDMLKLMKKNSLIVDIDCEPNGTIETCRFSTFDDPVYVVDGIRHLCVSNLPSAISRTSSTALSNATFPYALEIANKGWLKAVKENEALRNGLDFTKGHLTFKHNAEVQKRKYTPVEEAIKLFDK